MQFLFPQDEPVADSERAVPHGAGVFRVGQGEDGLNVSSVKAVRPFLKLPSGNNRSGITNTLKWQFKYIEYANWFYCMDSNHTIY